MFIQTEQMPDPARMKFFPGEPILPSGTAEFPDEEAAESSPLANRLFAVDGVDEVILYTDSILVVREPDADWQVMKPAVLGAIMDHFASGAAAVAEPPTAAPMDGDDDADPEAAAQIKELIETRIRPAASQSGGDVQYHSIKDGVLYLQLQGSGFALLPGIRNVVQHYRPEITDVRDYRDAIPKPGLDTPEGKAIQELLDQRINPAIASHGGYISLIDVKDDTAFVRLEGGCQGCGMADATLKQGVEIEIMSAVPSITSVYDVTDHAEGKNPYYRA